MSKYIPCPHCGSATRGPICYRCEATEKLIKEEMARERAEFERLRAKSGCDEPGAVTLGKGT